MIHRPPQNSPRIWADVSLFSVALIWGLNIPIMKIGLKQTDVFLFNAIRLAISALTLWLLAFNEPKTQKRIHWLPVTLYSLFACALYQILFLLGIAQTSSGNTALIISTVPLWTALLAHFFLRERLRSLAWKGLLIALLGTLVVAFEKGDVTAAGQHLIGNILIVAAALAWATGTVYSRPILREMSPLKLAACSSFIALPIHLAAGAPSFLDSTSTLNSASLWAIMIYSGVLSSGIALPLWHFGVKHAGAAHAAIIQNVIPLIAILAGWAAIGETPTFNQLGGGLLILLGLVIMRTVKGGG